MWLPAPVQVNRPDPVFLTGGITEQQQPPGLGEDLALKWLVAEDQFMTLNH